MPQSTVVITGLGVVSSIGIGADAYFDALVAEKSGITSLADRTDEGAKPGAVCEPAGLWIGGPVIDFDPKQYVRPRKALKVMCREIQTAYAASQMAVEQAGLGEMLPTESDESLIRPCDVGTVFGSEMFYGPPSEMEDAMRECIDENRNFDASAFGAAAMKKVVPLWMLKYLPNMPACHVGISLNAHGPNNTLVLGDISGPAAMIEAESCLQRKIASIMISGASGTRINTTRMNYRGDLPIADVVQPMHLSSRPYDPTSRGVVGGEAAAAMVMENSAEAASRGAEVIARVVSYASRFVPSAAMRQPIRSSRIQDLGSRGSASAIASAIDGALRSGGLTAEDIALVVGHAAGDPVMDQAEAEALARTLPGIPVTAPAAAIGHTGAAIGTVGVVTGALAIARKTIPPTIGIASIRTDVPVVRKARSLDGRYVLCLSHNSEGNSVAVILGS